MRLLPILTAILVVAGLYLLVFQREELMAFAARGAGDEVAAASEPEAAGDFARVGVVVQKSQARQIDSAVLVRGQTEAIRQVEVRAETSGQIVSQPLRKGASVKAGQTLCELDPGTREIALAEADARLLESKARLPEAEARLAEARARLAEAEINDRAASRLSQDGFASETRVAGTQAGVQSAKAQIGTAISGVEAASSGIAAAEAAVAAANREIERLTITAPFDGLLETDTAELGTLLQPGALCGTVIQLDPVKLVGFVPETEVARIQVGAMSGARLATGHEVAGKVTFLSRAADPETRTFRVEVEVANDDLSIRDGQTAEIMIAAEGATAHLLPQSALTLDDDGNLGVRLVDAEERATFQPVRVLRDSVDGVFVSGLPETAEVIVVGQEYVTDGVPVAVTYREPRK